MSILGLKNSQLIFIQLEHLIARLQPDVTLLHRIEMLPDVFFCLFVFFNVINIIIVKFLSNIVLCCLCVFF